MRKVSLERVGHWSKYLVLRTSGDRRPGKFLRKKMKEAGVPYRCNRCPVTDRWNGSNIRLEVNHINGNNIDDRLENLELLCPNCHSQHEHSSHDPHD